MILSSKFGPVTIFRMGKHVASQSWTLYETHAFLLEEVIIDTGTAWVEKEWKSGFGSFRCAAVINTHHHEDHSGNNRLFQDTFGAAVYAHPGALPFLEDPHRIGMQLYRKVVWKEPAASRGTPLPDVFPAGKYNLQVIPAPGHCPDHVCLYEPENGLLFSGDIFCGRRFDYLRKDEDFNQILESLKALAGLEVRTIFCGFKGAVEKGSEAIKAKIQFMEELKYKVLELYGRGIPPRKIKQKLLGPEKAMCYITFGHYSKQNTIDDIIRKEFADGRS